MKENFKNGKPELKETGAVWSVKVDIPTAVSHDSIRLYKKARELKLKVILN
ncbi:hypothetical protein [Draconibacterium orientale]|jgi:hypothetical protein|uniref:hypothetical protein n=1 Tax=Draconibacterium orientale TaxID=1168034 RepID=UPI0029C0EA3A|nr:hypothetical protein [Draconibacterium orientale]